MEKSSSAKVGPVYDGLKLKVSAAVLCSRIGLCPRKQIFPLNILDRSISFGQFLRLSQNIDRSC